jgi:hypothetical protein
MMARPHYRRNAPDPGKAPAPVALPQAVFTVHPDGTMTVTIDDQPYPPAPFAPPWQRDSFPTILDALTSQHRTAIRVEVRETDGTVFTDIITPARRHRAPLAGEPALMQPIPEQSPIAAIPAPPIPTAPSHTVLHGDGFVPGEDVAVAVIVGHSDAAPDGTARALITPEHVAGSPTREVILLGRISGTLTIERLP